MRAAVIVDADDYFRIARSAMLKARKRIMLIGWDFDARIDLDRQAASHEGPTRIGDFIHWLVEREPELEVFVLRWDIGALKTLLRGTTIFTLIKWWRHPRIHLKLDSEHPPTASHHQKIVVLDDNVAFCGGIDMTGDRWDTREHADRNPYRHQPNGTPYGPWHGATMALEGPAARALGDLARERWTRASGQRLAPVESGSKCWPEQLNVHFHAVDVGVARTAPELDGRSAVFEIERLYLDFIASAERFIYIENQYFASRRIAAAIAKRLDDVDGPEIVVISPCKADGWLEPLFMDTARARLVEALRRRDHDGRFRIYHPFTPRGTPIYVHSKIMIVDDVALRVGSSNVNSRSMRLDTECDIALHSTRPANLRANIRGLRDGLLAEHLRIDHAEVAATIASCGSLVAAIELLRSRTNTLRPYETPDLSAVEEWLAENNVLGPDQPDGPFEPLTRRRLFRRSKVA